MSAAGRGRVVVVGLGPAGPDLVPEAALTALRAAAVVLLRTARHPAVAAVDVPFRSFDALYEQAADFDEVYAGIVEAVVTAATEAEGGTVAYVVPGSPFVAERTVAMLRADARLEVTVVPGPSFLDLAWDRLGVDPLAAGVRLVDAATFATAAAGDAGPLLVGQVHSRALLSEVKLAVDDAGGAPPAPVTVLHHLGLPDESVRTVAWDELDRVVEPDHLTAVWIPRLAAPVAAELVRLEELVRTLRARCPWDREQTHGSLARHLLEEAYEALDAMEALAAGEPDPAPAVVDHLEEELGDLLFQVFFHAVLGAEAGRFTLADVARGVHDKLVGRHPHVFGDAVADTPEQVAARWEVLKKAEKGRASVTEGIPAALPALALAAKLQRKAESVGLSGPGPAARAAELHAGVDNLAATGGAASGETLAAEPREVELVGEALFALADLARRVGVDPETALRAYAQRFRRHIEASE
jgi:tetrapyrrole methylase family protein/MazG family protein